MSWLAPAAWILGGVALATALAAHLLSRRRPDPRPLPTARFVPERPLRVTARGIALSDVLLLLLRAATIVALVAAFAGPLLARSRGTLARVVIVDRSRAVASAREVADSARGLVREGDALVVFDTAARVAGVGVLDSLGTSGERGSVSAALALAMREGARLARTSDSVMLAIVSPLAIEELDAATLALRDGWPGRLRLVRVAAAPVDSSPGSLELTADDGVAAGLRLAGVRPRGATVRLRRSAPAALDSAWARERGHILVHWPAPDAAVPGWRARSRVDTIGGLAVADVGLVAPFARRWRIEGTALGRFADGEIAIADRTLGDGCIRDVAIGIDPASDLPLRPEFRALASAIALPCGGVAPPTGEIVGSDVAARLAGSGPLATARSLGGGETSASPGEAGSRVQAALLALALLLLAAEWWARRERSVEARA